MWCGSAIETEGLFRRCRALVFPDLGAIAGQPYPRIVPTEEGLPADSASYPLVFGHETTLRTGGESVYGYGPAVLHRYTRMSPAGKEGVKVVRPVKKGATWMPEYLARRICGGDKLSSEDD